MRAGQALSQAELDGACEQYLRVRLGEQRDFAIENSLPTLLADGLIAKTAQVGFLPGVDTPHVARVGIGEGG